MERKDVSWEKVENELVTLSKMYDKACQILAQKSRSCFDCPFSQNYHCLKNITQNKDESFDCDRPEWWSDQIKEMIENDD